MFDFEPYVEDLENAGAEVVDTSPGNSGPFINVRFHGTWPVLQQKVEREYILLDQFGGPFDDIRMVIRPVEGMAFDPTEKGIMGDIEGAEEIPEDVDLEDIPGDLGTEPDGEEESNQE